MNANRILLIVLILLTVLAWILPPFTTGIKHNKEAGIGEKGFLEVGGVKQGMIIKGNDMQNPVLLFLSGGPGILFGLSISDFFRG